MTQDVHREPGLKPVLIIAALLALLLLAGGFLVHRPFAGVETTEHRPVETGQFGTRSAASIVGIQPWLQEADYRSAQALRTRLGGYLDQARREGFLTERSVVVFPEHTGTWLVAANAPAPVYSAETVSGAMTRLILARPLRFVRAYMASQEADRAAAAVFRAHAPRMARDYQAVFSGLAEEYAVTIAAGSIVLADPVVQDGVIRARTEGPLYNVSAVFGPDGRVASQLVRKAYPIPSESGFTAAAPASDYPVFDTPAGRLGVLICADSWHPDVYAALEAQGVEILAAPAFLQPSGVWDEPWGGYTTPWPDDAERADAGRLTEGQAWQTHALAGRLDETSARAGLTSFLRGELWDLGSDGRAIAVDGDGVRLGAQTEGAAIAVLWLAEPD